MHKSTIPKNSLQLLQWLIFEPVLFERYEKTLAKTQTKTQTVIIILKAILINFFIVIIPLTFVFYAINVIILAVFDLPLIFPPPIPTCPCTCMDINEVFVQQWQTYSTWWEKAYFFATFEHYKSLSGLVIGLTVGLVFGLAVALVRSLALSFVIVLIFSLALSLALSLTVGLARGFTLGLLFPFFFYLGYFCLWLYPWYFLKSLVSVSLTNNPYMGNGTIWLPIWGMIRKLTAQAATAGYWQQHPLQRQYLLQPPWIEEMPHLLPSLSWFDRIDKLERQFKAYEKERQSNQKKKQLEIFCIQLAQFRDLTTSQPYRWHRYYLPAIDEWQTAANEKLTELTQEAQR